MFKVQVIGTIYDMPILKRIADKDVCNFTLCCKNANDRQDSFVRCTIWGGKALKFFEEYKNADRIYIEGDGLNKKYQKDGYPNRYVFILKCRTYQILT